MIAAQPAFQRSGSQLVTTSRWLILFTLELAGVLEIPAGWCTRT
jgi:hypothetical protein